MNVVDGWIAKSISENFKPNLIHSIQRTYKRAFEYVSMIKSTEMFSQLIHQYDYYTASMDTTPIGLYTCFPINDNTINNILTFEIYKHPMGCLFKVINPHMVDISSILREDGYENYEYYDVSDNMPLPRNIKEHEWELRRKVWNDVLELNEDPIIGGLCLNGKYRSLQSLLKKAKINQIKSITHRVGELVHRSGEPTVERMVSLNNLPLNKILKPLNDPLKLLSVSKYTYLMDM